MAAIELPSAGLPMVVVPDAAKRAVRPKNKPVLCLPKGLVDPGEKPLEAALREVREETGITAVPITKLGDSKYVYVRSWGDGERVFKIVSFYLLRYESGRIDNIDRSHARRSRPRQMGSPRRCSQTARLSRRKTNGPPSAGLCQRPRRTVITCSGTLRLADYPSGGVIR